jgi:hypothetical protein
MAACPRVWPPSALSSHEHPAGRLRPRLQPGVCDVLGDPLGAHPRLWSVRGGAGGGVQGRDELAATRRLPRSLCIASGLGAASSLWSYAPVAHCSAWPCAAPSPATCATSSRCWRRIHTYRAPDPALGDEADAETRRPSCPACEPRPLVLGDDRGETGRALLGKARRFPILVEHVQPIGGDPAGDRAGHGVDRMGGSDRGGPGRPEHSVGRWANDGTSSICSAPTLYRMRPPSESGSIPPTLPNVHPWSCSTRGGQRQGGTGGLSPDGHRGAERQGFGQGGDGLVVQAHAAVGDLVAEVTRVGGAVQGDLPVAGAELFQHLRVARQS